MKSVIFILLSATLGGADNSGPPSKRVFEDRDSAGRVIRRVEPNGRTLLFSYDDAGLLVRVAGRSRQAGKELEGEISTRDSTEWTHCFAYVEGRLVEEFDCMGRAHPVSIGSALRSGEWTTLKNHRHPIPLIEKDQKP